MLDRKIRKNHVYCKNTVQLENVKIEKYIKYVFLDSCEEALFQVTLRTKMTLPDTLKPLFE